ncbi:SH3 domain-containing protein [Thalassotalea fusca]
MNQKYQIALVLMVILTSSTFAQAENHTAKKAEVVKKSPLLETPSNTSEHIKQLSPNQSLNVYERQRAWYRVTTSDMYEGWVKMLNLRMLGRVKREGELGVVTLLDSVNPLKSKPTTSTGIRGFDEEDLMSASANLDQVALLENFVIDSSDLKRFVVNGQLSARKIKSTSEEPADD